MSTVLYFVSVSLTALAIYCGLWGMLYRVTR